MFDANDGIEPSHMWRDLAAFELDRQQLSRAQEVMSRIKDPHVIISMRVDRRFDPLRNAVPQYFRIEEATVNAIDLRRSIAQRSPRSVNAIVQLTYALLDAGRSDEALSVLPDLGSEISPFGLMQMHGARHAAALHKGDMQIANESFEYLDKHRDDALGTWQWALLVANRLDEAAVLLIERLNNPLQRAEALQELQIYANPQYPPQRALWDERLKKVRERNDVMRAVEAVGRIESYFIPESPI